MIHDITPPITTRTKVWPGDTPVSREVLLDMQRGDNITLSTLRATVHLGAHADGPNHYGKDAPSIAEMPLDHYLGPCQVVDVNAPRATRIRPEHLAAGMASITEKRVLLRTRSVDDPQHWNEDFAALSVELVEALAAKAVITIGIDTPSVDLFSAKVLEGHHAILKHRIAILEGLDLRAVAPGRYELIALPLPLTGFDASPVRAILRTLRE